MCAWRRMCVCVCVCVCVYEVCTCLALSPIVTLKINKKTKEKRLIIINVCFFKLRHLIIKIHKNIFKKKVKKKLLMKCLVYFFHYSSHLIFLEHLRRWLCWIAIIFLIFLLKFICSQNLNKKKKKQKQNSNNYHYKNEILWMKSREDSKF